MYSVALINRALMALNEDPVPSVDDLDNAPARVIKLIEGYDQTVAQTLKAIGRGEFVAHVTLTPLVMEGDWKFPYRYQLPNDGLIFLDPADCLEIEQAIEKVGVVDQWVLRAKSNAPLELSYVRRVPVDLLSSEVFEAVGLALAAKAAWNITGNREHSKRVEDKAERAIMTARAAAPLSVDDKPRRRSRMGYVRGGARRFGHF